MDDGDATQWNGCGVWQTSRDALSCPAADPLKPTSQASVYDLDRAGARYEMTRHKSNLRSIVILFALALNPTVGTADESERKVMFAGVSDVSTTTGCERLTLNVDQTTSGSTTETWIQYFVVDKCKRDAVVASGAGAIPNAAFTLATAAGSVRLQTSTVASGTGVSGTIDLTWTMTNVESWSATNTWRNQVRDVVSVGKRSDEQRSAEVIGTIIGLNVRGTGQFGWTFLAEAREPAR
jgi:hypothetical protein